MKSLPKILMTVALAAVASGLSTVRAATLTAVPMQGMMAMPMVGYHAEHGHLHVEMPEEVPQLTPLLISNPGDNFDAADPWFDDLDPSRRGLAFSRRYGFVMDADSDPIPADQQMWIRKLDGPAELGFYRYAGNAPKAWQPIFGTAGSTNELFWNGMMFHPAVTAPPGTNQFTALFQLLLKDAATGEDVPASYSPVLEFVWTDIRDGRPALNIGLKVLIDWPTDAANYVLESADSPVSANWTLVTSTPVTLNGRLAVVVEAGDAQKAYRLKRIQ